MAAPAKPLLFGTGLALIVGLGAFALHERQRAERAIAALSPEAPDSLPRESRAGDASPPSAPRLPEAETWWAAEQHAELVDKGRDMLLEMVELYDYQPQPIDRVQPPILIAERLAQAHRVAPFANRYQAITASLSPARAAEVIDCMSRHHEGTQSAFSDLEGPLPVPPTPWEPFGKWKAEQWLMYDDYYAESARDEFTKPLLERLLVPPAHFTYPSMRPTLGAGVNPEGKSLSDEQWEILSFAYADHDETIRSLILDNGLFEAQLAARQDAVARGAYEAVPGLSFGSLERCDRRPKERMSVNIMYVLDSWALRLVIMQGQAPELDNKLAQLNAAVALRDAELRDYIASF